MDELVLARLKESSTEYVLKLCLFWGQKCVETMRVHRKASVASLVCKEMGLGSWVGLSDHSGVVAHFRDLNNGFQSWM